MQASSRLKIKMRSMVVLGAVLMGWGSAWAQQTQNPLDAIKNSWKKTKAQAQQKPQAGQQKPAQTGAAQQPGNGAAPNRRNAGPPPGTKVEQTLLAPIRQGDQFGLSPHGVHAATLSSSGSRYVMVYDGNSGPVFDRPIQQGVGAGQIGVTFSRDGEHYAYCAQAGDHFIVMLDGKQVGESSHAANGALDCEMFFSPNGKHFYYTSNVSEGDERQGLQYTRFIIDGKKELRLANFDNRGVVFSPDGEHFAMVANFQRTPQQIAASVDNSRLIVDGEAMPYVGGAPQWSADSKHLYTTVSQRDGSQVLQLDGKPIMHADRIDLKIPPVGDMTVAIIYVRTQGPNATETRFLVVGGKKVPESTVVRRGGNPNSGLILSAYISPDGKHYAAICSSATGKQFVFADGKKGLDYDRIDGFGMTPSTVTFSADSSKAVYLGFNGSKDFLVVGDQEMTGLWGGTSLAVAPVGPHVGTFGGVNNPATLDGKPVDLGAGMSPVGGQVMQMLFSPDGQHYAFNFNLRGQSLVYVDGQAQSSAYLAGDLVFSSDSKHIAYFCHSSSPSAGNDQGLCLDGKYTRLGPAGTYRHLTFTPDGSHLLWTQTSGQELEVIADGSPVFGPFFSVTQSGPVIPDEGWQMQPDGTLLVIADIDNAMKRVSVTPSPNTSLAMLFGGTSGLQLAH